MKSAAEFCRKRRHNFSLIGSHIRACSNQPTQWTPTPSDQLKTKYDAIIIGAGHNGLVAANYLAKAGKSVCVLESRHCVGGAAVTEEIVPGFKFSRCSYLLSLFRPSIMKDLKLKEQGLQVFYRNPYSYTPLLETAHHGPQSLIMWSDEKKLFDEIAKFSKSDAEAFPHYVRYLHSLLEVVYLLIDSAPVNVEELTQNPSKLAKLMLRVGLNSKMRNVIMQTNWKHLVEIMTAPASKILSRWFESDVLKSTLATDSVIGAMMSPHSPGSAYVLLHHVMGEFEGKKDTWCYVRGGMGALSDLLANSAKNMGVHIFVNSRVQKIVTSRGSSDDVVVRGIVLNNGQEIHADQVLSNATPEVTFKQLMDKEILPPTIAKDLDSYNYDSPVTKINVAVDRIPDFLANPSNGKVGPWHQTSTHLNSSSIDEIHQAYLDAIVGETSRKPLIEMTIPSSLDDSLVSKDHPGGHVVQLFTQYTPFHLTREKRSWTEDDRQTYLNRVFDSIEEYAPGFKNSVIGYDMLTPVDLQNIFGLTGGNIFHGSLNLNQLYFLRPLTSQNGYETFVRNMFLCGSSTHPGGGVTGACGKLAAEEALKRKLVK